MKKLVRRALQRRGITLTRYENDENLYQSLYSPEVLRRKPFFNVGAGDFQHKHWTCIDFKSEWYGNRDDVVHHDLMSLGPLPIDDGAAKIIYTSHTVEHVSDEAVRVLFREAFRALEPGGIFRVTTGPDAETDYRALMNGDANWFYWNKWYDAPGTYEDRLHRPASAEPLAEQWLYHVATKLAPNCKDSHPRKLTEPEIFAVLNEKGLEGALDYFASLVHFDPERPGNHISWWTHEKVERYMREAGFTTVYRSGYQQSAAPVMRRSPLFDSTHPQISLYVEAIKTAA